MTNTTKLPPVMQDTMDMIATAARVAQAMNEITAAVEEFVRGVQPILATLEELRGELGVTPE